MSETHLSSGLWDSVDMANVDSSQQAQYHPDQTRLLLGTVESSFANDNLVSYGTNNGNFGVQQNKNITGVIAGPQFNIADYNTANSGEVSLSTIPA